VKLDITANSSDKLLKRIPKETTIKLDMNLGCHKYGGSCIGTKTLRITLITTCIGNSFVMH